MDYPPFSNISTVIVVRLITKSNTFSLFDTKSLTPNASNLQIDSEKKKIVNEKFIGSNNVAGTYYLY